MMSGFKQTYSEFDRTKRLFLKLSSRSLIVVKASIAVVVSRDFSCVSIDKIQ